MYIENFSKDDCICYTNIGKTDNKGKIIQAEATLGRFQLGNESVDTSWILTKDQLQLAKQRLRQISIPYYLNFNLQQLFMNLSRLKSHDWKQVCALFTMRTYEIQH